MDSMFMSWIDIKSFIFFLQKTVKIRYFISPLNSLAAVLQLKSCCRKKRVTEREKMRILAAMMSPNLFSSPPPNPRINDPPSQNAPPPLILPPKKKKPQQNPNPSPKNGPLEQPIHTRTKYYKPIPKEPGAVISGGDGDRSVVVGPNGISYRLPNAPFEFQFSYSETPKAAPLAVREPAFLPFAPETMNRPWTGKAPLLSKKEKERKKKIRLFEPVPLGEEDKGESECTEKGFRLVARKKIADLAKCSAGDGRSREEILGQPLTRREARELVRPWLSKNRQVNLGMHSLSRNSRIHRS